MSNGNIEILLSAEEINARVKEIAAEITRDYAGKSVTLVCALKGAVFFLADLARQIELDVQLDFLKVSSYGNDSKPAGEVSLEYPDNLNLLDKHIIMVEDIVDMGYTAKWLMQHLQTFSPASVSLCALLDKPDRRIVEGVDVKYLGFSVPNEFVVGYGLDYAQRYRCLPYIGILKDEEM